MQILAPHTAAPCEDPWSEISARVRGRLRFLSPRLLSRPARAPRLRITSTTAPASTLISILARCFSNGRLRLGPRPTGAASVDYRLGRVPGTYAFALSRLSRRPRTVQHIRQDDAAVLSDFCATPQSVSLRQVRQAIQRTQRRCAEQGAIRQRYHRPRGALATALQAEPAGSDGDKARSSCLELLRQMR